jgi:hypothetical protein
MRKSFAAALVLAVAMMPAASATTKHASGKHSTAGKQCFSPADIEAEQALMTQSFVMVLSSECRQDMGYGEFKVRNRDALISYQKGMMDHFRRNGARSPEREYESWITRIANQTATAHAGTPALETCAQSAEVLKLDPPGFHDYVQAQVVKVADTHPLCHK